MRDEIPRNGGGTGYGGGGTPEPAARRPATRRAVPPFEAAWLRAVGCSGAAANGARLDPSAGPPAPPFSPSANGNGHPAGGVDSTRGGH